MYDIRKSDAEKNLESQLDFIKDILYGFVVEAVGWKGGEEEFTMEDLEGIEDILLDSLTQALEYAREMEDEENE